jgi:uncharacterized protein
MTRTPGIVRRTIAAMLAGMMALMLPAKAAAEPAMWVIEDADSKIYLFGTIHLLPRGTEWRSEKINRAISESSELWLEIADLESMFAQLTAVTAVFSQGLSPRQPLSERLTPEQYEEFGRVAETMGYSARQLDGFRPWLAGMMIEMGAYQGADIEQGADLQLSRDFRKRQLPVRGFETIGQQVRVFSGMSPEDELQYLLDTVRNADPSGSALGEMAKIWAEGDDKTLDREFVAEMKEASPEFYDAILTRRNQGMADKIERILAGSRVSFVAVGAAHLVGPDSIQALLARKGIKSTRH